MFNGNVLASIGVLLLVTLLSGCSDEPETPVEPDSAVTPVTQTSPQAETPAVEPTTRRQPLEPGPDAQAARQAAQAQRDAQREARQQVRRESGGQDKPEKTPEEKAIQREQRRMQRQTNKAWWNKKGKGDQSLNLQDDQIATLDGRMQELLNEQKQLAEQLTALRESNRLALQSGSVSQLENNLSDMANLEQRWQQARNTATVDMLNSLTPEQLQQLGEQGGDIANMNWFDIDLAKAAPKSNNDQQRQQRRQQRRQERQNNPNNQDG